jgi:hypothetical protein
MNAFLMHLALRNAPPYGMVFCDRDSAASGVGRFYQPRI